jgi:energy-coupling factor transport system ATP-binding protein
VSAVQPAVGGERGLPPPELATAAAMAAVCVGLVVVGSVVPYAGALQLLVVVPFGIVAHRHRLRALIASLMAAAGIAVLVIGLGNALELAVCALLGGLVGELKRRGRGERAVWLCAALLAPAAAAVFDGLLYVFASYRQLVLASLRSTVRGFTRLIDHVQPLRPVGAWIDRATATLVVHWPLTAAAIMFIVMPALLLMSWMLIGHVLDRLRWVGGHGLAIAGGPVAAAGRAAAAPATAAAVETVSPLPVELHGVTVRYGPVHALFDLDLRVPAGQFIAVVGDNGSGKSTLARLLAGARPTAGVIHRDGAVGLGRPGGTAMITQRPEAQVIGLRVADDVVWGLPEDHAVDVEALLQTVGLAGMSTRDTATLSGGQLQRLAVAAALARGPRLLISDESTAMVDPAGRAALVALFAELPRSHGTTVVHITHHDAEAAAADRVLRLERGRLVSDSVPDLDARTRPEPVLPARMAPAPVRPAPVPHAPASYLRAAPPPVPRSGELTLRELGHNYGHDTVWEHRALEAVTLSVDAGEGLLVVGENGSGKSTLAWIIAGLLRPTYGLCLLDGQPVRRRRGAVAIAFQHARLQLQRPTVGEEIIDAAGWLSTDELRNRVEAARTDPGVARVLDAELNRRVARALSVVRLEPELATRSIEELSGGQQRRVAIAGLLARDPHVLVLDEPLAGLDAPARAALIELLGELRETRGLTLVVVTHDPELLAKICPRMIRLERGRVVSDTLPLPELSALEGSAA